MSRQNGLYHQFLSTSCCAMICDSVLQLWSYCVSSSSSSYSVHLKLIMKSVDNEHATSIFIVEKMIHFVVKKQQMYNDNKILYLDHTVLCVMYVSDTVKVVYGSKECYKRSVGVCNGRCCLNN